MGGVIFPCKVATFSTAFNITTKLISHKTEHDNQLFTNFPNKTAGTVEFTLGTSSDVGKQYNGMVISGQERTPLYMYAP